jgi:hypothetical protein
MQSKCELCTVGVVVDCNVWGEKRGKRKRNGKISKKLNFFPLFFT